MLWWIACEKNQYINTHPTPNLFFFSQKKMPARRKEERKPKK